jgi:hypothetical protein
MAQSWRLVQSYFNKKVIYVPSLVWSLVTILLYMSLISPTLVWSLVTTLLYMSLISPTYFIGTLYLSKTHHVAFLGIFSYTFTKSMKTICRSFFFFYLYRSITCLIKKIAFVVDLPGMKPNWFIETHIILVKPCSITLSLIASYYKSST